MKANENAAAAEKRSTKAFYPELPDEDGLEPRQKAEPAAPQSERFDDNDRRAHRKIQSWHAFQTP
jgi:hypothetical protein